MALNRHSRRRRAEATVAALLLPAAALLVSTGPAQAVVTACSGKPQDINGDGFADIVIGELRGGATGGGRLHVFYGTANGPATVATGDAPDDQIFAQGVGGIAGVDSKGDAFGATVQMGDLNDDGCADVAVGLPGNASGRGAVAVLYGSITGLTGTGSQFFTEDVVGAGEAAVDENFGAGLSVGDFDGDGVTDLAAAAPFDTVGTGTERGAVVVLYGSTAGVNKGTRPASIHHQNLASVPGTAEDGDAFGFIIGADDVTADGISDVVVGVPGENLGAGIVQVLPGSPTGVGATAGLTFSQDSVGVPGAPEDFDNFGYYVTTGDVNGDGAPDLVTGVPGEDNARGIVQVIYSDPVTKKLTTTGAQSVSQAVTGVDGVPGDGDFFGAAVAVAKLDGDAFGDVVIGTPYDAVAPTAEAGSVSVMRGSATGMTTAGFGGVRITQDTVGVAGSPEKGDLFGFAVTGAAVQGAATENLVISSPGESISGVLRAGSAVVLTATATGPSGTGSDTIEAGTANVAGARTAEGRWGWSID
ncbi:MAG: FG-GAP repeat protein [Actinobacteria bacterium]|nr:FG-GAP repeat protein [Actinomycetota bacterium]